MSALILTTIGVVPNWLPPLWDNYLMRVSADLARIEQCQTHTICSEPALQFLQMTKDVSNIGVINRTVNMSIKGETEDHWASPLETTASMSGNCVAEAMLKATIAVVSGFPAETMRLALINDNLDDPGHAVLLVLEQNGWVVLDNDTLFRKPIANYPNTWAQLGFK